MEFDTKALMRLTKAELVDVIHQMNSKYDELSQIAVLEAVVAKDQAVRDVRVLNEVLNQMAYATGFKREMANWDEFPAFLQFIRTKVGKGKRKRKRGK
ncbi:hypothetical protein AB4452_04610 [Vibrio lentus]